MRFLSSMKFYMSKYLLKTNELQSRGKKIVLQLFVVPTGTIYLCDPFLVT
jgi:hypothetical protein